MDTAINLNHSYFEQKIHPYDHTIRKYCTSFTSNPWEAEDLLQDSLLKIYLALKEQPDRKLTKKYLYQIIKNTWIDTKRKKQVSLVEGEFEIEQVPGNDEDYGVREILEVLADFLTIKQFVILLLSEVFRFTAKETAELIHESESTIYSTLHRGKTKLKRYMYLQSKEIIQHNKRQVQTENVDTAVFERFLEGFRLKNPKLIYETYLRMNKMGVQIGDMKKQGKQLCFTIKDPDGNVFMICS
ncbi:RNA polymerase sigma factor [Salinibacillus xinjiangensis]|uniref:RNA polymerase sigma factor n=1 Tax=Salinibacillus xinjiangensis TaxID=1229268 RepID=UPI0018917710|nr:RNA polymerase sigma factor [Salinibacillus xinjiangensis]